MGKVYRIVLLRCGGYYSERRWVDDFAASYGGFGNFTWTWTSIYADDA